MTFSKELREAAQPIIEDIYNDGFIQDLLAGTLSKQAVRQLKSRCVLFEGI